MGFAMLCVGLFYKQLVKSHTNASVFMSDVGFMKYSRRLAPCFVYLYNRVLCQ